MTEDFQPSPAFVDVSVQPSYGPRSALINWQVQSKYRKGDFFIFRSPNGVAPWTCLNALDADGNEIPIRNTGVFEDLTVFVDSFSEAPHYRILLEMEDDTHHSPVVGPYTRMSKREYAGAYQMLKMELLRMSRGNGTMVWHCIPLTSGEVSDSYDPDTMQEVGVDCPDTVSPSYGLPFKGGFGPPIATYVEFGQMVKAKVDAPEGQGSEEIVKCPARMLAFPQPALGQMLVHPAVDERWLVGEKITPYLFKGTVAISYDVELTLLRRSDLRYNFPLQPLPRVCREYKY